MRLYLSALCLGLLAVVAAARAQAGFTPRPTLEQLFDLEGRSPFTAPYDGTLTFGAFASRVATAHGHGYRNELKIMPGQRRPAGRTREHFAATVTPTLPMGARTIVAQYHVDGLDTVLKVYVQDTDDRRLFDGRAGNGVFDVVVSLRGVDGREVATALGTVRSGASFALDIVFEKGVATVRADSAAAGPRQAGPTRIADDGRAIYFKFGDYLQALDPATGAHTTSPAAWDAFYRAHGIDASLIRFSHTVFERD